MTESPDPILLIQDDNQMRDMQDMQELVPVYKNTTQSIMVIIFALTLIVIVHFILSQ